MNIVYLSRVVLYEYRFSFLDYFASEIVALCSSELSLGIPIADGEVRVWIFYFILNRVCCILLVASDLHDNANKCAWDPRTSKS